jgi:two-component system sensor histidine kinase KdpD
MSLSMVQHTHPFRIPAFSRLSRYLLNSVLACTIAMFVTMVIYLFHLYPRIPNISIVYLLMVQALASTRGRYAAILSSVVAFLAFDFFLVPPLYILTINRVEEWIALFVFLVTAILTSQLAAALRERAERASRRERETHILYDLLRVAHREEKPERQLSAIARTVVIVLSSWGVQDCAILQPHASGTLSVEASAYQPPAQITLSPDEQNSASWVMAHGRPMDLYEHDSSPFVPRAPGQKTRTESTVRRSLRLIPLKLGEKAIGVLRLKVLTDPRTLLHWEQVGKEQTQGGAPTSFFWIFLDQVTAQIERVRLQQENMRIEILQRTDALRAALLSSVSHDLRTPLTAIKAAASSLRRKHVAWDEEARCAFAQAIESEADRLNRLVGNLLDMSRIEEGALRPKKEEHALAELIRDVLDRLNPLMEGRAVCIDLPPGDLLPVHLDYLQIDQVLTNLIENAVRHTPPGSPIEVTAYREGTQAVVSVADRGPGVPLADLAHIFDKFYRVQHGNHAADSPGGSGLGLAVCKGLVEAHGGHIWAKQREGGGLIVCMTLPLLDEEGTAYE